MSVKEKIHEKIEFTNIRGLVEWAGEKHNEKIACSYKETPFAQVTNISYTKMRDDVRAFASELLEMGVPQKHVVLLGKHTYEWVLTYLSVLSVGGVVVPLDREWGADELCETALFADVSFVFCDEDIAEKGAKIAERCTLLHSPIYFSSKENKSVQSLIVSGREKFKANPSNYYNAPIDPMKMSLLVFTSGTTGKGKGVMLSQNAVLSCLSDSIPYIDFGNKTVSVLPLHHTYGSSVMIVGHIMIGANVYISSGLKYIQKELKEQKPEHLILVPLFVEKFYKKILTSIKEQKKEETVARAIVLSNALRKIGIDMRDKLFAQIREAFGGNIKMLICGGAPMNPEIAKFFDAIGISVINGYGITECAPLIAFTRSRNIVIGSIGKHLDIDKVVIDHPNSDGEGELLVKGENVMLGYYKNEDATAKAFKNGYFRTGDYGKFEKNGMLYITGRKKNLIILSNGKNVYPEEIETEISTTPGIVDVIVYEGQSRRGLEHNAIVAEIYPDKEFFEKEGISDINEYFKPFIEQYNKDAVVYKRITLVRVREQEFPKNTLKKILRFKIDTTID